MINNNRTVIVAGNVSSAAWKYMQVRGAQIEEKDNLVFVYLPEAMTDLQHWQYDDRYNTVRWAITFNGDSDEELQTIILELEPYAYESRIFLLSI